MKHFNIYALILFILLTSSYASNHVLISQDTNISLKTIDVIEDDIVLPKKKKESSYKKFERIFSDYDGTFVEDMFLYSADIMMPDEIMQAVKDVIKNRDSKSYSDHTKEFPKTFSNDIYNVLLTTSYYYMQDISRITQRAWNKAVCSPDTFKYEISKEPKQIYLALKENDDKARGVTRHGIVLPVNHNFPDAKYPYASKPNGCSTEELEYAYDLSNTFSNDDKRLNKACDEHDKCYYTEGTTYKECNAKLIINTIDSCNEISGRNTLLFMGTKNAFCGMKALAVSTGANTCAEKYFNRAQKRQKAYNAWVERYEKSYLEAKQKSKKF